jgi:hypothetical protein
MRNIDIINSKLRYDRMDNKCMEFSGIITENLSSLLESERVEPTK